VAISWAAKAQQHKGSSLGLALMATTWFSNANKFYNQKIKKGKRNT